MSTELSTTNGHGGIGIASGGVAPKNPFEAYSEAAGQNRVVGELLRFSKGEYAVGKDGTELPVGTELVANLDELLVDWMKWEDSKPADMRLGKVVDGFVPPRRAELGDTDESLWELDQTSGKPRDPWQKNNVLVMMDPRTGSFYTFTTGSAGGMSAVAALAGTYGKHIRTDPSTFPIVKLAVRSYMHSNKAFGKIKTPDFEVIGWHPKADVLSKLGKEQASEAGTEDTEAAQVAQAMRSRGRPKKDTVITNF